MNFIIISMLIILSIMVAMVLMTVNSVIQECKQLQEALDSEKQKNLEALRSTYQQKIKLATNALERAKRVEEAQKKYLELKTLWNKSDY